MSRAGTAVGLVGKSVLPFVVGVLGACTPETPARRAEPPPPPRALTTPAPSPAPRRLEYPPALRGDVVDEHHGVRVPDPYRWLEDPDAPATRTFIDAQNRLTRGFLDAIPERATILERLEALWSFERFGVPTRGGSRLFYSRADGLENQPVLYVQDGAEGAPRVLFDPNALSAEGTLSLRFAEPSDDGRLVAYGVVHGGSDWTVIRVRDVDTGKDLPDELRWVKFSEARWSRDGKGFFYSRFPEPRADEPKNAPNFNQRLHFHRIGASQAEDALVYERPDEKTWSFQPAVTDDGRYLVVTVAKGTDDRRRVLVAELSRFGRAPLRFREVVKDFDAGYSFIGSRGSTLWFRTNRDAPNGRVVAIDVTGEGPRATTEIIPEAKDALGSVRWVDDRLVATYLVDARSDVRVFDTTGKPLHSLSLPGVGTVRGLSGRQADREVYFSFTSFATPHVIYELRPRDNVFRVFRAPKLPFDPTGYETKQVFATSKDGTKVPVFLSHRKGLVPSASTPAYLHGYGGFNIPVTPSFDVGSLAWMERGGLLAVASLRGGGEYGKAWHEAGMKHRKQNVFDDFIAAAEWLVTNRQTSPARVAIGGRSNGGLLVGVCMTQRPDLFGVALPAVGVMDMLRYHRFTIGWAWGDEYGTADDPAELRTLLSYSPLHNLKPGTRYPATLITAADHDDRVVPAHSLKFAAALQAAQGGEAPVLLRVETVAGHGAGTPTRKRIEEEADRWAFVTKVMGL